eukprot:CFRG6416T1
MEAEYLFSACRDGNYRTIERLLQLPTVNVEARDQISRTPLHVAARGGHEDCVKLLIDNGAENDRTALHNAASKGHDLVVRRLIIEDASVNLADEEGDTPLHLASRGDHLAIVRLLLAAGADINASNENGWTATHLAAQSASLECVQSLVAEQPDLTLLDGDGETAVEIARKEGKLDIAEYLAAQVQLLNSQESTNTMHAIDHSRAEANEERQWSAMRDLAAQLLAVRKQMSERDRLEEEKLDALITERDQIFGELRATKSMLEEKEWEDKEKYTVLTDERDRLAEELNKAKEERQKVNQLYAQLRENIALKEADDANKLYQKKVMSSEFTIQMEELKIEHESVKAEKEWLRSVVDMSNEKCDQLETELANEKEIRQAAEDHLDVQETKLQQAADQIVSYRKELKSMSEVGKELEKKLFTASRDLETLREQVKVMEKEQQSKAVPAINISLTDDVNEIEKLQNKSKSQLGVKRKTRPIVRMFLEQEEENTEIRVGSPPSPLPIRSFALTKTYTPNSAPDAYGDDRTGDILQVKLLSDLKAAAREKDIAMMQLRDMRHELDVQYLEAEKLRCELAQAKEAIVTGSTPTGGSGPVNKSWHLSTYCEAGQCGTTFGLFKRRHHCRSCGNSVCSSHSLFKSEVLVPQTARVCPECI